MNSNPSLLKKTAARMMAVQCLYQNDYLNPQPPANQLIARVTAMQAEDHTETMPNLAYPADEKMLKGIVAGYLEQTQTLEAYLAKILKERWEKEKLSALMKAILRAATYELIYHPQLKPGIIINEYVTISAEFYDEQEIKLLNGLLQELANSIRGDEITS